MKPNRGGFVPIGELAGTLPGLVQRGGAMSANTRHHFTTLRQVNQLIEASEADADMGFMARLLALCSLPRTNPKQRNQYVRRNGPYALYMTAGAGNRLPFGNLPRLLLAWVCSEAVRTQRRELVLGLKRPRFSWTRIKGESNVQGGGENGSVEGRGTGRGIGTDGGSPEGDWSPCRRRGGRGGLPGAGAAVERQPEARRGAAAAAWRIAGGAVP